MKKMGGIKQITVCKAPNDKHKGSFTELNEHVDCRMEKRLVLLSKLENTVSSAGADKSLHQVSRLADP